VLSAIGRGTCFIFGMAIGKDSMEEKKISVLWLFPSLLLYAVLRKYLSINASIAWMVIPLMLYVFLFIVKTAKRWITEIAHVEKSIALMPMSYTPEPLLAVKDTSIVIAI
jgi:RsiW-degrading membrane proteinase PrsW (M82 family)